MKFSYRWLSDLVPGLSTDPTELQRSITLKTAECEGVELVGAHLPSVVAVLVKDVQPLPKGKNKLATVSIGHGKTVQVVCGADNVRPGLLTAWIPPGTALEGAVIGRALIDGVESEGMLASGQELGINRDHSGLLELTGVEAGQPLPGLGPDWVIEIDNKSLTHRPDLWGHHGMAREVAALTGGHLIDPVKLELLPAGQPTVRIDIENPVLCSRFTALTIENIQVAPSPLWLQARLENIGLNPINNVVDVTNYILAELPQPMHAYDADKLRGNTIFVRMAKPGERLAALNDETYDLKTADLVIADAAGPIGLAGVIGGAESAISKETTRIILESANFQAASVRLTSARHKLRTDASMRFEKSLDPENTVRGLARAIELLKKICPAIRIVGGVNEQALPVKSPDPISLPVAFVVRKLGTEVSAERMTNILLALGFGVDVTSPGLLTVTVPSWRATKDITSKDDLMEEVGRMIGYGEIAPVAPMAATVPPPDNPIRRYLRSVRFEMAAQGFSETYNYSFVNETELRRFGMDASRHLAVLNPIASELTHLRRSLLPGLFQNIVRNVRHFLDFRLFEIGRGIHPQSGVGLPDEITHLAAVSYNAHGDEQDFFEAKRVVECLFPGARLMAAEALAYEHPMRTATIRWSESEIGRFFELHPSLLEQEGVEGRAVYFDVDLELAHRLSAEHAVKYTPLRKYPTSGFDLSILTGLRVPVDSIEDELTRLAKPGLTAIEFVRQYAGPPLPEGQKSVSYHLEVGSREHTLTADEVAEIRNRVIQGMRDAGFELRI